MEDSTTAALPPRGPPTGGAWLRNSGGSWGSSAPRRCVGGNRGCWPAAARTTLLQATVQMSRRTLVQLEG